MALGLALSKTVDELHTELGKQAVELDKQTKLAKEYNLESQGLYEKIDKLTADLGAAQGRVSQLTEAYETTRKSLVDKTQLVDRLNTALESSNRALDNLKVKLATQQSEQGAREDALQRDVARFQAQFDSEVQEHAKARAAASTARQERSEAVSSHARLLEKHTDLTERHDEIESKQGRAHRDHETIVQTLVRERDQLKAELAKSVSRNS